MPYDPKWEAALDALAAKMILEDQAKLMALPAPDRAELRAHVQEINATLSVGIVFLQGFEEIATAGELAGKVPPEVKQWVTSVPRNESGGRIAGMIRGQYLLGSRRLYRWPCSQEANTSAASGSSLRRPQASGR